MYVYIHKSQSKEKKGQKHHTNVGKSAKQQS